MPAKKPAPKKTAAPKKKAAPAKVVKKAPAKVVAKKTSAKPAPVAKKVVKNTAKPAPQKIIKPAPKPAVKTVAPKPVPVVATVVAKPVISKPVIVEKPAPRAMPLKPAVELKFDKADVPLVDASTLRGAGKDYPKGYVPNDSEKYMNPKHLSYFRDLLLQWRDELSKEGRETVQHLQEQSSIEADLNDQATIEYEQTLELRTRDRERKLISKIDEALERIKNGTFGYCEETGDPIGIKRLLARPIATLSIEAKLRQEKKEFGYAG